MGASSSSPASTEFVAQGPEPSKDDYEVILRLEMYSRAIRHRDLSRWSPRTLRGYGHAECKACPRQWTSYQASAEIDIKSLTIMNVWRQKCKTCHSKVYMSFREDDFRKAVIDMLDRLEREINGVNTPYDDTSSIGRGPPHIKELCEGCNWGSGDCRDRGKSQGFSSSNSSTSAQPRSPREEDRGLNTAETVAIGGAVAVGAAALIGGLVWAFSGDDDNKGKKK